MLFFLISTVSVDSVFLINCESLPSTKFHFTSHFSCSAQDAWATLAHHADNDCCHIHTYRYTIETHLSPQTFWTKATYSKYVLMLSNNPVLQIKRKWCQFESSAVDMDNKSLLINRTVNKYICQISSLLPFQRLTHNINDNLDKLWRMLTPIQLYESTRTVGYESECQEWNFP